MPELSGSYPDKLLGGLPLRVAHHRRGFTLIELLIVVAIIGILATLLLGALFKAKERASTGVAKSQIQAIKSALAMYESDHGKFPRRLARTGVAAGTASGTNAWADDAPALYIALRNKPTRALGGGQNSPYLEWKADAVGIVEVARFSDPQMHNNAVTAAGVEKIPANEVDRLNDPVYQQSFVPPGAPRNLAFLDPWGNPYHYREWRSCKQSEKDTAISSGGFTRVPVAPPADAATGPPVVGGTIKDQIHAPDRYDIWSNGPNGVNEYGFTGSDDVTSWSN